MRRVHHCPQIVSYFAQGQSRSHTCDIFRISGGQIRPGDSAFYHDIIHIPPLPPSRLDHCRLIHVQYVITVSDVITARSDVITLNLAVPNHSEQVFVTPTNSATTYC